MDTNVTLAPAAGAGIGKLLADSLLTDPEFVPLMRKTAIDALGAMSPRRWDKDTGKWIADPDMRTRAQMFFGLLAHMEGEPVKRIIHQHLGAGGQLDIMGALRESPALLAAAEREIEKAKWRTSGKQANKVPKKAEPASDEPMTVQ
jgi:hypothetical protein